MISRYKQKIRFAILRLCFSITGLISRMPLNGGNPASARGQ
jgi:hypothetical protein